MSLYPAIKRSFDFTASALGLLCLLPVFVPIGLAIVLETPGPVFFGQLRVGKHGRPFRMWKFRSMMKDAPNTGLYWTAANDPRITRVGMFLRRTSIDELPQLINVLMGSMSLIGPRPFAPQQEGDYTAEEWILRHQVKPGITGLAQSSGRSTLTPEQRTAFDLQYAANPTLLGDLRILWNTARCVLCKEGAM